MSMHVLIFYYLIVSCIETHGLKRYYKKTKLGHMTRYLGTKSLRCKETLNNNSRFLDIVSSCSGHSLTNLRWIVSSSL